MTITQSVRCPNCGKIAQRLHISLIAQVETQCSSCDYLMVSCTRTGKVIEAYYPGLNYQSLANSEAAKLINVPPIKSLSRA